MDSKFIDFFSVLALSKIIVSVKSGASFNIHHLQTNNIVISSFLSSVSLFQNNDAKSHFFSSFSLPFIFNTLSLSILISKMFIFFIKKIATINITQIAAIQIIFKIFFLSFFTIFVLLKAIKKILIWININVF
jgi:hypothetical protein